VTLSADAAHKSDEDEKKIQPCKVNQDAVMRSGMRRVVLGQDACANEISSLRRLIHFVAAVVLAAVVLLVAFAVIYFNLPDLGAPPSASELPAFNSPAVGAPLSACELPVAFQASPVLDPAAYMYVAVPPTSTYSRPAMGVIEVDSVSVRPSEPSDPYLLLVCSPTSQFSSPAIRHVLEVLLSPTFPTKPITGNLPKKISASPPTSSPTSALSQQPPASVHLGVWLALLVIFGFVPMVSFSPTSESVFVAF
jgi:hypothetical protein